MKRFAFAVAAVLLWVSPAHAAESVQRFDSLIDVRIDSSLRVTETVIYDMDGVQRHGWERILPKESEDGPHIVITDITASRDGADEPVSAAHTAEAVTVRIGDPDRTLGGTHTYVLSYTVQNAVRYFDDRDEVYWNAIPQGLRLPVMEAKAVVQLPDAATVVGVPFCYTGFRGSPASECTEESYGSIVTTTANRPLSAGEGMTIAVAVTPGALTRVAPVDDPYVSPFSWLHIVAFSVPLILICGVLIVLVMAFRHTGLPRERSDGGDIVVQYDPPQGCSAPEAAYFAQPSRAGVIFTAAVVQLAVEGWLKMQFSHEKKFYGTKTEILFSRSREGNPEDPTLHQAMDALFIAGPERTLTELRRDAKLGAAPVLSIAAGIPLMLIRRGWQARTGLFGMFSGLTDTGRTVKEHLAGLKLYLGAAEKERLAFHNAPEHSPQTFEKLLPYAIALGVDEPWLATFGDLQYTPAWTSGDYSAVGMIALSEGLGDLSTGAKSVMNAYSSGTGSGGSGGGGSSGGGSGGGGGGGW